MREDFYECSAGPQNERAQRTFYTIYQTFFVLSIIALCIALYLYLIFLDLGFLVISAFVLIFGVIIFFVKRKLLCYYDYTYVSGEVRIVKVINCKRRKTKLIFDSKEVFQVGKVGSESYESLKHKPNIKVIMTSPNGFTAENQLFYVAAKISGEDSLIIMECNEKLLSFIVAQRGRSVIEKDYK